MRTIAFVLLTLLIAACAPARPETPPTPAPAFKTSASVKQLMTTIVIPASDIIFDVGSKPPEDEAEWARVENAALVLAESGNLLMIGDRAKQEPQWMESSLAMIDAAQSALAPLQKKNLDEVLTASDNIYKTCDSCHDKYMDKGPGN